MQLYNTGKIVQTTTGMYWQVGLLYFNLDDASPAYEITKKYLFMHTGEVINHENYSSKNLLVYSFNSSKDYSVFDREKRKYLASVNPGRNGKIFCEGWYLKSKNVKVDKVSKRKIDTLHFYDSTKRYEFDGTVTPIEGYESADRLLIKVRKIGSTSIGMFDLELLAFQWVFDVNPLLVKFVNKDIFYLETQDSIGLHSVAAGEKLRSIDFTPNFSNMVADHLIKFDARDRVLYAYNAISDDLVEFNFSDQCDTNNKCYVNVVSDEVLVYIPEQNKFMVYSLSKRKLLSSWYLPCHLFECERVGGFCLYKVNNYYVVSFRRKGEYETAEFFSIFAFHESELSRYDEKWNVPSVFDENVSCQYERVKIEEDLYDYHVTFDNQETFTSVYRNLAHSGDCIAKEFGFLTIYPNHSVDKQWSGRMVYDLSNQALSEQERNEIYLLARSQVEGYFNYYRAGCDSNVAITIDLMINGSVRNVQAIVAASQDLIAKRKSTFKPITVDGISRALLYEHRKQLQELEWLNAEDSMPAGEVELWVAMAEYQEEYFWITDGFKHESETYYGSLLKWLNSCCDSKLGVSRVTSHFESEGEQEFTVLSYTRRKKRVEQRYVNERRQISEQFLNELAQLAGKQGVRLVFNEKMGLLGCFPATIDIEK